LLRVSDIQAHPTIIQLTTIQRYNYVISKWCNNTRKVCAPNAFSSGLIYDENTREMHALHNCSTE
jgi:hypothetical protein